MGSKKLIVLLMICLLLIFIAQSIGITLGYFSDTESSVDNILRFTNTW
jgi:predicted ribosomally synthesized peptide with SipW-like signal peptide